MDIILIEQQIINSLTLNKWFKSPLGAFVAQEFTRQFKPEEAYLRGELLLQLGDCGENRWLNHFHYRYKWLASPVIGKTINLVCSLNQIPLNRNSVDCVLVPLTLEPFLNYLSLIDEIDRILKPMGFVVFLNINPFSLWGGALKLGVLKCFANHRIKMHTPFNLNRIFMQRGYKQCFLNNFCYIPPVNHEKTIKKMIIFNEIGKMVWPFPSGLYCYIAQKYEYISPSLIEPVRKEFNPPMQPVITSSIPYPT